MNHRVYRVIVGELQTNCYILADTKSKVCAIIDPGGDYRKIKDLITTRGLIPSFIINTHGHADHIMADEEFNLPIYIHRADAVFLTVPNKNLSINGFIMQRKPDRLLEDGDVIKLGPLDIKVIHTPGHTPGGICLLCDEFLFSGDTLFASGIGRTDLPGGHLNKLLESIREKLFRLDDNIIVYPGHGPATTIGQEKRNLDNWV